MCEFTVIGISDSGRVVIDPALLEGATAFSGGRRHHEIVAVLLPPEAVWVEIAVPLSGVFDCYRRLGGRIVVFASGDPLFYGFASTLKREFPDSPIHVVPTFNSLQTLAHRLVLPYQDMRAVSLTGRPWQALDAALIEGSPLIGILTDRTHTPATIARRMLDYGYDNYDICVGENLGNELSEAVSELTLHDATLREWTMPNCIILRQTHPRPRPFGIPESRFELLDGRANMITKMPVRLLALSLLALPESRSMWDIGFCTGSVSIEARLQFPHLDITSFEVRPEGRRLMELNTRRFGAPGIRTIIADFLQADLSELPTPDAVFIGGHGGRLPEMLTRLAEIMHEGGRVVFNSVSPESCRLFTEGAPAAGFAIAETHNIVLDSHNPITIFKAVRQ